MSVAEKKVCGGLTVTISRVIPLILRLVGGLKPGISGGWVHYQPPSKVSGGCGAKPPHTPHARP